MKIYVVGDIHAEFDKLNAFISAKQPDMILQCGDFGYWPELDGTTALGKKKFTWDGRLRSRQQWYQCSINSENTEILFCDGNHEDHQSLRSLTNTEICPNIFYMPRGSTRTLLDGRTVLFIGGAQSGGTEKMTPGRDWFAEEEIISREDINQINTTAIDIVISHTCPQEFLNYLPSASPEKLTDKSTKYLSEILHKFRPSQWYFGHFHASCSGTYHSTEWHLLNMATEPGWFVELQ